MPIRVSSAEENTLYMLHNSYIVVISCVHPYHQYTYLMFSLTLSYTHTHTHTHTQGGLIIDDIFPEGNAYRDARLCIGDRIIEIDDQDFTQKTLAQALLALSATTPLMSLKVIREPADEGKHG